MFKDSLSVAPISVCIGFIIAALFLALASSCKHVTDKPVGYDCIRTPQTDGGVHTVCVIK